MPLAAWIILAVVGAHVIAFWLLADKRVLPKARYVPPPSPANFGGGQHTYVDPRTGEITTEREFVVSTALASPSTSVAPSQPGPALPSPPEPPGR